MNGTMQLLLVIFLAITAFSLFLQVCIMVGMAVAGRKMQKKIESLLDDVRMHAVPLLASSRTVIEDLTPKIKAISSDVVESSDNLCTIAREVSGVVGDVTARTKAQAAHVEDMVDETLDQITHAGNTLQHGIAIPVRQVTGILNGIRAAIEVWRNNAPRRRSEKKDLAV